MKLLGYIDFYLKRTYLVVVTPKKQQILEKLR